MLNFAHKSGSVLERTLALQFLKLKQNLDELFILYPAYGAYLIDFLSFKSRGWRDLHQCGTPLTSCSESEELEDRELLISLRFCFKDSPSCRFSTHFEL